jgi:hypothetical protein
MYIFTYTIWRAYDPATFFTVLDARLSNRGESWGGKDGVV